MACRQAGHGYEKDIGLNGWKRKDGIVNYSRPVKGRGFLLKFYELLDSCVLELDVMDLHLEGDAARFLAGKGSGDMIFCKRTSNLDMLASFFRDLDDHVIDPYPIWGVELFPQDAAKRHTVLSRILVSRIPDDPCSYHIDSWIKSGKKTILQCHDIYGRHGICIEIFSILLDTLALARKQPALNKQDLSLGHFPA